MTGNTGKDNQRNSAHVEAIERHLAAKWHSDQCGCELWPQDCKSGLQNGEPWTWTVEEVLATADRMALARGMVAKVEEAASLHECTCDTDGAPVPCDKHDVDPPIDPMRESLAIRRERDHLRATESILRSQIRNTEAALATFDAVVQERDGLRERESTIRVFAETRGIAARALGEDGRGWLDLLALLDRAAQTMPPPGAGQADDVAKFYGTEGRVS